MTSNVIVAIVLVQRTVVNNFFTVFPTGH